MGLTKTLTALATARYKTRTARRTVRSGTRTARRTTRSETRTGRGTVQLPEARLYWGRTPAQRARHRGNARGNRRLDVIGRDTVTRSHLSFFRPWFLDIVKDLWCSKAGDVSRPKNEPERDLYRPWPESTAELYKLIDYSRTTSSNASEARRLWADRRKGYQNTASR
jgi:hypothetical protein